MQRIQVSGARGNMSCDFPRKFPLQGHMEQFVENHLPQDDMSVKNRTLCARGAVWMLKGKIGNNITVSLGLQVMYCHR